MYQQTSVGGWGTLVAGVFDYKDQLQVKLNYDHNHEVTSCNAWNFLKKQNRDILKASQMPFPHQRLIANIAEMKAKLGDEEWIKILAKRSMMTFTNQIKALALFNDFSKPNWIWFGIFRALTKVIKISKPIWIWFRNLAKSVFFFPNQTGIGSENPTHFLGVTFPNQSVFGLERGTEWNVAALQWFQTFRPIYSDNYLVQSVFNNTDSCLLAFVDIHTCKN